MMPLHQYLEPGLDIGALGVGFKAKHVKRATLGIEDFAALGRRPCMPRAVRPDPAKQTKRVIGRPARGGKVV